MLDAELFSKVQTFSAERGLDEQSAETLAAFLQWLYEKELITCDGGERPVDSMPTLVELRRLDGRVVDGREPSEIRELPDIDESVSEVRATTDKISSGQILEITGEKSTFDAAKLPSNLEDLGRIGFGGTGEVRRVLDRNLNRMMAIKLLRPHLAHEGPAVTRFLEEAQVTAQLQHPGIVAVHDVGRLKDGRYYFTMEEVYGRTLKEVIAEVHRSVLVDQWRPTESGWTFRRLIDAFRRVCEAMAYAHSRGVVHRDLKPSNIMLGEFGEVLVLDWGIAKVIGAGHPQLGGADVEPVHTRRSESNEELTLQGEVPGTPAYMPVEQARGKVEEVGPASDVYSLGAILYTILSGHPPYSGGDGVTVLMQVLKGPPAPVGRKGLQTPESLLPAELKKLCEWTLSRSPSDRPKNALAVQQEVARWLEGAKRREQAEPVLDEADARLISVREMRMKARELRSVARDRLSTMQTWDPVSSKKAAWSLEDEAAALEKQAEKEEIGYLHSLRMALSYAPGMPGVHGRLAEHYHTRHQNAEDWGDTAGAHALEILLREHDQTGQYATYLRGDGALTLVTEPPGAEAILFRCERIDRRLELVLDSHLGQTPVVRHSLPRGSYVVKLRAPGHEEVIYPIHILRGEVWDCVKPGSSEVHPIVLPKDGTLDIEDIYVPGGWFLSGGDDAAPNALRARKVWVDSFVLRQYPITHRDYLVFLNALVDLGHEELSEKCVPRTRGRRNSGHAIYVRDDKGRYHLPRQMVGGVRAADLPVTLVDWRNAWAYCKWLSSLGEQSWRLPWELEWSKAARGVDGRKLPWGDFFDATWACVRESHAGAHQPSAVDGFVSDTSVYGVMGMAGNVMEPCCDAYTKEGPMIEKNGLFVPGNQPTGDGNLRAVRGGHWNGPAREARLAARHGISWALRAPIQGIRLCRGLKGEDTLPDLLATGEVDIQAG